jgi:hypothetical protein
MSGMSGAGALRGAWEKNPMRYARRMHGGYAADRRRLLLLLAIAACYLCALGAIKKVLQQLRRMLRHIGPERVIGEPFTVDQRDQPVLT